MRGKYKIKRIHGCWVIFEPGQIDPTISYTYLNNVWKWIMIRELTLQKARAH